MDLALNNLQRLICHKTQLTNQRKICNQCVLPAITYGGKTQN